MQYMIIECFLDKSAVCVLVDLPPRCSVHIATGARSQRSATKKILSARTPCFVKYTLVAANT